MTLSERMIRRNASVTSIISVGTWNNISRTVAIYFAERFSITE
ncbi:hypothetical protein PECL_152 [Pediococcus claussenii ATCC BAA-344]|uniref:Uncharacterized protein n=1 Tax=Pediococcus claussenii (strain ATCC BAA-344 / DSM 14800 / JCM 18046 / KCTC 3811 / LMG 21948 / P06) TaxID=701521 RepID=G8PEU6_PEDCP|nr:hypothetical protein PECL_152 [Pediococcus claussenii ATCC BAA-344]